MTKNITDKELDRDIANLSIPLEDQHIPVVSWDQLEKIYGKKFVSKLIKETEEINAKRGWKANASTMK